VLQLNRLYAVLTRTSESIVRIRERDACFGRLAGSRWETDSSAWPGGDGHPQTGVIEPAAFAGSKTAT